MLRQNRYDAGTDTLTLTADEAESFQAQQARWAEYFSKPTASAGLPAKYITDPVEIRRLTAFFAWTAWASSAERPGHVTRSVSGMVCVLSERPIRPRDRVLLRAGTRTVRALVEEILDQLDIETVEYSRATSQLDLNDIGRVRIRLADDLPIDDYHELRRTGAFLLIDESDGATLAAGMADAPERYAGASI